jgi:hypothetical protein
MKLWFLRICAWCAFNLRLYYAWSKFYRFIWERKYNDRALPSFETFSGLIQTVNRMKWRRDDWLMLWDAISTPKATYFRHVSGEKAGDCDDISLFAVNRLADMIQRGVIRDIRNVGLLSVPWVDVENKGGGHNVGVYQYMDKNSNWLWAHISNWYDATPQRGFATVKEAVKDVLKNKTSLGWARATIDLKLVEYGNGKDL